MVLSAITTPGKSFQLKYAKISSNFQILHIPTGIRRDISAIRISAESITATKTIFKADFQEAGLDERTWRSPITTPDAVPASTQKIPYVHRNVPAAVLESSRKHDYSFEIVSPDSPEDVSIRRNSRISVTSFSRIG